MDMNFKHQQEAQNLDIKEISKPVLRKLGIGEIKPLVANFDELRENPPNIIVAEPTRTVDFTQNYYKRQTMIKREKYVMGLGVFQQLHIKNGIKFLKPSGIKFSNVYRPYRGQELNNKTLLVFRTGGIGDLLFIQPNLIYLKEQYPSCKIKFACGPQYQAMIETWDCVDEVLDLPFTFKTLVKADYHALFEGVIERCKLAENVNSYNLFSEWLGLNLPNEKLVPKQKPKEDKVEFCKGILKEWGIDDFILVQPRASSPIRTPRVKVWIEMIDKLTDLGYNVVVTDSPRNAEVMDNFISNIKNQDKIFNFTKHSESLDYSIALMSLSSLVLATDSAMVHVAASLGKKIYGIYGPFPGFIRLNTYPNCKWIDAQKDCAPCYQHGQMPCKNADRAGVSVCYDNIDLVKVTTEINEMIGAD